MSKVFRNLLFLAAMCSGACAQGAQPSSHQLLRAELVRLSGTSAKNCGFITLKESLDSGWACALAADKIKQPFWLAVQHQGIDSEMWEVIGRDSTKGRYLLAYDSSPFGRSGLHPRFTRDICTDNFMREKSRYFRCDRHAP